MAEVVEVNLKEKKRSKFEVRGWKDDGEGRARCIAGDIKDMPGVGSTPSLCGLGRSEPLRALSELRKVFRMDMAEANCRRRNIRWMASFLLLRS